MNIETVETLIKIVQNTDKFHFNKNPYIQGNTKDTLLQCLMELKEYKIKYND